MLTTDLDLPMLDSMVSGLLRAQNVYVIGRGAGLGAAQEVALKLKDFAWSLAACHKTPDRSDFGYRGSRNPRQP